MGSKNGAEMQTELKTGCQKTARRITGRSTRIRTLDPLVPNQVRYRAAPHSEKENYTLPGPRGSILRGARRIYAKLGVQLVRDAARHGCGGIGRLCFHHDADQRLGAGGADQ